VIAIGASTGGTEAIGSGAVASGFQANDGVPNFLFRNNGDGTFSEVALEADCALDPNGSVRGGMGVDAEDLDNDGYQGPTTPPESNHHNKWESESEVNEGYEPEGLDCEEDDDEVQTDDEDDERVEYEDDEEHTHGGMDYETWHNEFEPEGLEFDNGEVDTHREPRYEHGELEDEELGLHEHELESRNGGMHELRELEYEEVYEPGRLEYERDEAHKHGELAYEPNYNAQADYATHEPRGFEHDNGETDGYTHPLPTPTHVPHSRDIPRSNQRGRTTTLKNIQHRTPPHPTLYYPLTCTHSCTALDNRDPVPPRAGSQHHLPPTSHTSHTNTTEHTPSPLINYLRPPPWPDPNVYNQNPGYPSTPSTTQFHPLPWPNDTHNTHLPQLRPPPWPD